MNSPAGAMAQLIVDYNLGEIGRNIFIGPDIPLSPDDIIALVDMGSYKPPLPTVELSTHVVRIFSRSTIGGLRAAYNRSEDINRYLHGTTNLFHGTYRYLYVFIESGPESSNIIREAKQKETKDLRPFYTTDFRMMRTPVEGGSDAELFGRSSGIGGEKNYLNIRKGGKE
jgi:hypothetical protein